MPGAPDTALLSQCRSGDVDAFGVFYTRHRERVLAYLARRVSEPEIAVDLMAETFARALASARDPGRGLPDVPLAWLFTIAKHLLIDSARRGTVESTARAALGLQPLELDDADLERVDEIATATNLIDDVRDVLTDREWDAFRARVLDDEPYPELAERLACSEAVVRQRVSRARARLRTAIGGDHD